MKIINEMEIYVQINDLIILRDLDLLISKEDLPLLKYNSKHKFVCLNNLAIINLLKNIDWIIDINELLKMSEIEINNLISKIEIEQEKIEFLFNNLSSKEQLNNLNLITDYEILEHQKKSLQNWQLYKHGTIKIKFPNCINLPNILTRKRHY